MKKFLVLCIVLCVPFLARADYLGLVYDTDSLTLPFGILDSTGNPTAIAATDSLYIVVYSPGGAIAFKDSVLGNNAAIKVQDWEDTPDDYAYYNLVSTLKGTATTKGIYTAKLRLIDISLHLSTTRTHTFQLQSQLYATAIDSLISAIARLDDVQTEVANLNGINFATDSVLVDGSALATTVGAITAATLNTGCITADEIGSTGAGEIRDSIWSAATRTLSSLDEDVTILDLNATAIGSVADSVVVDGSALAATAGAISATTIATDAITNAEIAADAIGASELGASSIGASELATNAIGADQIAADAIGASELAANAIGNSEIATDAIGADEIAADAIGTSELAQGAVDSNVVAATFPWDLFNFNLAGWGDTTATKFGHLAESGLDTALYLIGGDVAEQMVDSFRVMPIADTGNGSWSGLIARASDSAQRGVATTSIGGKVWTTPSTRTITGTGSGAITTSSFASGAITSTVLATDAITATQIQADAIGASEIAASAIGESELAAGCITTSEIATGAIDADAVADNAIDAGAIAADAITNSELGGAAADEITDSVWRALTNAYTSYTGSFGDVLYDSIDAKVSSAGSTSTITNAQMGAIADSVWNKTNKAITGVGTNAIDANSIAADAITSSELAASAVSEIAAGIGTAASNWSDAQRDSVLAVIADAGKTGLIKTGIDSVKAAVSDASIGDKVWIDAATRTLSSYDWTSVQRDSVLNAIVDNNWKSKTWGSTSTRTLTALDEDATTIDLNSSPVGMQLTTTTGEQLALMPDHWTAADSLGFQGSGANAGTIADAVWDEVLSGHTGAGSAGDIIVDSLDAKVSTAGSTATVSDADMGDIIDSLFNRVNADTVTGTTMAHLVRGAAEATLDSAQVARAVWNTPHANHTTSTTFGGRIDAAMSSRSSHSALDVYNTFISGVNERAFWINDSVQAIMAAETADSIGAITATIDSTTVARAVWNTPGANHSTAGTFGARLDVAVSSIAGLSGSGAYTRYVCVLDTSTTPDSVVASAVVFVNNRAQNTTPYQATTNNNGVATFNLDAGNWVKFTTEAGYAAEVDSFTVAATGTDTLRLYRDAGSLTTVAWLLQKPNGNRYASAQVIFDLVAVNDSLLYVSDSTLPELRQEDVIVYAGTQGNVSVNLWPNSLISGDSTYYKVTARDSKGRLIQEPFKIRVPAADTTVYVNRLTRW